MLCAEFFLNKLLGELNSFCIIPRVIEVKSDPLPIYLNGMTAAAALAAVALVKNDYPALHGFFQFLLFVQHSLHFCRHLAQRHRPLRLHGRVDVLFALHGSLISFGNRTQRVLPIFLLSISFRFTQ